MIPDFQSIMHPVLSWLDGKGEQQIQDVISAMVEHFALPPDEVKQLLPSGRDRKFANRVRWAVFYLNKAKLVDSPRRGFYCIADRGREILKHRRDKIDIGTLERYPEFVEFRNRRGTRALSKQNTSRDESITEKTPEDLIEDGYQSLRQNLSDELLDRIKGCEPSFFEDLVVRLLVGMGYGGSFEDAALSIGSSGDEGIDGIIKEDRLGLDNVYIQAKRWNSTVGRPEIQKFAGALQGQRARKGVFITTSDFSQGAIDFANSIESRIVLIDGSQLAEYMIDYGIGTTVEATYEIKRVDLDFFNQE